MRLSAQSRREAEGCSGGVPGGEALLKRVGLGGIGAASKKPAYYHGAKKLRVARLTALPVQPFDAFTGNPNPNFLYQYARKSAPYAPPVVTGRCPFCGVLGTWPQLVIEGSLDAPTLCSPTAPGIPADVHCNCPRCGHRWKVVNGEVLE